MFLVDYIYKNTHIYICTSLILYNILHVLVYYRKCYVSYSITYLLIYIIELIFYVKDIIYENKS